MSTLSQRPRAPRSSSARALWASAALILALPAAAEPARDGETRAAPRLGAMALAPSHAAAEGPSFGRRTVEGVIAPGRTLSELLRGQDVSPRVVHEIARELRPHFDFRHARPGHGYTLTLDGRGELVDFRYRTSTLDSYTLTRFGDRYRVSRQEEQLDARATRIAGVISTTLYQAISDLGEDGQLARDFSDIFAWDIDFQRSVQPGDSFQILYERLYRSSGGRDTYVRPGRVLAARFQGDAGSHTAVYYEASEGRGGYYRPNGSSVEGQFLMAPMRHARITSGFSAARRHPILKVTRPHRGIDYAAAAGTPVWSVASGKVVHRAWTGGSGNLVKVKHDNGFVSFYAHLSRYAKGLRVGDRVEQKQVIGYVGQTGLATGPHVCFRVQQNGKYVDPARLRTPAGKPIPGDRVPDFLAARDQLLAELEGQRKMARKTH